MGGTHGGISGGKGPLYPGGGAADRRGGTPAGDRLPTESHIAEKYDVSKTNVHLGVKELARLGFVDVVPRHAVYITDIWENITLEALDALFQYVDGLPPRSVVDALLELREMMACGVIRWMVRQTDPAHMAKLKDLCASLEQAAEQGEQRAIYTALREFLAAFYQEAGNRLFPLLVRSVRGTMLKATEYIAQYVDPLEMAAMYREMVMHIDARDTSAAVSVWTTWNDRVVDRFLTAVYPETP